MDRKTFLSLSALGVFAVPFESAALASSQTQKRVALVFANQNYEKNPLPNIVNDANAMEAALKQIGFTVTKGIDLSRSAMLTKLREFRAQIEAAPGCVALVYYSGHGAAVGGENYLIPIQNASLTRAEDLPDECVGLSRVLDTLGKSEGQLNLVILDACRDNPFPTANKSQGSKGLAVVARSLVGTLISFAASPGEVASANPSGANSLFTQELIRNLVRPGLRLEDVFIETRNAVVKKSGGTQLPREDGALQGQVFLAGPGLVGGEGNLTVKNTVGRLVFTGLPAGAVVSVDGKSVSGGEYEEDMSAESREVEVVATAPGFRRVSGNTKLERGKALTVRLPLEKLPTPPKQPATSIVGGIGKGSRKTRKGDTEMVFVPGGTFGMGKTKTRMMVSDFWMDATPVTVDQWKEYCAATGKSMPKLPGFPAWATGWDSILDHPMVNVSWHDASAFAAWAGGRLPTGAEFEYAARDGGLSVEYPWGNTFEMSKLWLMVRSFFVAVKQIAPPGECTPLAKNPAV